MLVYGKCKYEMDSNVREIGGHMEIRFTPLELIREKVAYFSKLVGESKILRIGLSCRHIKIRFRREGICANYLKDFIAGFVTRSKFKVSER